MVAVTSNLGLQAVDDLGVDRVEQVLDDDTDGVAAPVGEASGSGIGPVPERVRCVEDGRPALGRDPLRAAHREGDERFRNPGERRDVVDRRTVGCHFQPISSRRTGRPSFADRPAAMAMTIGARPSDPETGDGPPCSAYSVKANHSRR